DFPFRGKKRWQYRMTACPECRDNIIELAYMGPKQMFPEPEDWFRVYPRGANRGPVPPEVPKHIADHYIEACNVLPGSAKASAALARRCLQNMLHDHGYKAGNLAKEIDLVLNEPNSAKAIPTTLRQTIDSIRNFGNFSAHPITDVTTLQVIDVEP